MLYHTVVYTDSIHVTYYRLTLRRSSGTEQYWGDRVRHNEKKVITGHHAQEPGGEFGSVDIPRGRPYG